MGISSMQSVIIESLKALEKWQAGPKFFLFGSLFTKRLLLWGSVVSTASVMPPSTAAVKRVFCSFRNNGNKIDNSNEEFTKTLLMLVYTKTQGFGSFHVDWYQKALFMILTRNLCTLCSGLVMQLAWQLCQIS